jgi:hypothetical protein
MTRMMCPCCKNDFQLDATQLKGKNSNRRGVIVRCKHVFAKPGKDCKLVPVNLDDPLDIMKNHFGTGKNEMNAFPYVKILPFVERPTSLTGDQQRFDATTQQIVFEFDRGSLEFQKERILAVSKHVPSPMYYTYSGNKSLHCTTWFKHFANSAEEYKHACFKYYAWLCREFPGYFYYSEATKHDEGVNLELIPDISMFSGSSRYTRQPFGMNENGTLQKATILHGSSTPLIDLKDLISNPIKKENGE